MKVTVGQLAERLGVEYAVAANLVKLIVSTGQGKEAGKVDMGGKKGKPAVIYELPDVFTISLVGGAVSSIQDASNPLNAQYGEAVSTAHEAAKADDEATAA